MTIEFLQCKIHMAVITHAEPDYQGSLTLDLDLMEAAGLRPNQKILVANATNGSRLETYIIQGESGSGVVGLNGAAALHGRPGDKVIIMGFCQLEAHEADGHRPNVVFVGAGNRPIRKVDVESNARATANGN